MFKRFAFTLVIVFGIALPASAKVTGVYGGLKFIDSIYSTGVMSRSGLMAAEIDSYTQNTIGGGIFVGYDFYPQFAAPLRVELEYAIRTNASTSWDDTQKFSALTGVNNSKVSLDANYNLQTLLVNAYVDFHSSTAFTPYIGAGIGMGFIRSEYELTVSIPGVGTESGSFNQTDTVFAWNVGAGCSYAFTENVSLDLSYRFLGLGYHEVETVYGGQKQKIGMAPYANEISLAARFTF